MENISKQIQKIKVNIGNLDHIGKSGEINGSLFMDIKNLILEKEIELNKVKEELFIERHLVKVKQKEKEMMAEQLIECYRDVNGKTRKRQKSLWDEVAFIFDDSTTSEIAISRCLKLFTVDRKEIDKSVKP